LFFDWFSGNVVNFLAVARVKLGYSTASKEETEKQVGDFVKIVEDQFLSRHSFVASSEKITVADLSLVFLAASVNGSYGIDKHEKFYAYY